MSALTDAGWDMAKGEVNFDDAGNQHPYHRRVRASGI